MLRVDTGDFALGVDIGGTFTDLALLDRKSKRVVAGKSLTDYEDFARGVIRCIATTLNEQGIDAASVHAVIHGTTLATNALIQRRGARTALIVTRGFRDILETARGTRYDIFDLDIEMPPPLVSRAHVFEISERVDFLGRIIAPLAREEVKTLAQTLANGGFESVAVCLFHAYANSEHEREIASLLSEMAPSLSISLSSDVVPAIGEYDRATTTVANVYLQPIVRGYLAQLQNALKNMGIARAPMIIASDGGTMSCDTAARFPVRLIESGPAGGAIAAAHFAKQAKLDHVIGFDMGGTTAKVCIIDDFEPERATEFEAARVARFAKGSGLPLKVPAVEMIEIGAGGGSIAHVDLAGLLKVGPESAGASPGPACYGFGADRPTVTDADLCLGYLNADFFLGGAMGLDKRRAARAIAREIAAPLKLDQVRAAWGIHDVVNNNMARAAKIHCMERGKDPRLYTLVAFGGAGPIHAFRVAQILGVSRILYPAHAGIMSSVGFLIARPSFEAVRTYERPLTPEYVDPIVKLFAEMEREGSELLHAAGVADRAIERTRELGIRYRGQAYVLFVPAPKVKSPAAFLAHVEQDFALRYKARYHRINHGVPLEVVTLRALLSGPRPEIGIDKPRERRGTKSALKGSRPVYLPERAKFVPCPVYDRYVLNGRFAGPAIIEERESTVVVGEGGRGEVDANGNLLVTLPRSTDRGARR
jgi:N-methylhydantoinase A/oxoprolinase/acetone carboxylase beta subunit